MNLQLKKIRKLKGYTQEEMAQKLDIKKSRYGTWERGEANMSLPQACDVADILECTLDELAGRDTSIKRSYLDRGQNDLNRYYENMNELGRDTLLQTAEMMASSPSSQKDDVQNHTYEQNEVA